MFRILEFPSFKPLCEIDTFSSYSYTKSFYDIDNLVLQVSEDSYTKFYQVNNIIYFNSDTFYFIKGITSEESNGETIYTINAVSPIYFFNQRLIYPPTNKSHVTYNTNIENIIKNLINDNVVNPRDIARKIDFFNIVSSQNRCETLSYSARYNNLLESLLKLAEYGKVIITKELDLANKKINIDIATPQDLTETGVVIFSKSLDNLSNIKQEYSEINEKNTGIVGDYREGVDRKFYTIYYNNKEVVGLDRKEVFIDGSSFTEGEVDTEDYNPNYIQEMLDNATLQLLDLKKTYTIEFTLNDVAYFKPFVDYNVGDLVWVVDKELNIKTKIRIAELRVSASQDATMIEVIAGNPSKARPQLNEDSVK